MIGGCQRSRFSLLRLKTHFLMIPTARQTSLNRAASEVEEGKDDFECPRSQLSDGGNHAKALIRPPFNAVL